MLSLAVYLKLVPTFLAILIGHGQRVVAKGAYRCSSLSPFILAHFIVFSIEQKKTQGTWCSKRMSNVTRVVTTDFHPQPITHNNVPTPSPGKKVSLLTGVSEVLPAMV